MGSTRELLQANNARIARAARADVQRELGPRYALGSFLGQGAFASVYRVFDRATGKSLAVKRLQHKDPRFYRELQSMFRVAHPNVVRVINLLEPPQGGRYLFLELCIGGSLAQARVGRRTETPAVALWVVEQIARGLEAIHAEGLVHRDLKPTNVLLRHVSHDLEGAQPKVTDFGLARFSRGDTPAAPLAGLSGSPHYMAPEQFSGESCFASDVYALGVILFELIVGHLPFAGTVSQVARQHTSELPELSGVPRPIRGLVARLLAKSTSQRGAAKELVGELEELRTVELSRTQASLRTLSQAPNTEITRGLRGSFHLCRLGGDLLEVGPQGLRRLSGRGEVLNRAALPDVRAAGVEVTGDAWLLRCGELWRVGTQLQGERHELVLTPVHSVAGEVVACAPSFRNERVAWIVDEELRDYDLSDPETPVWTQPVASARSVYRLSDGGLVVVSVDRKSVTTFSKLGDLEHKHRLPGEVVAAAPWLGALAVLCQGGGRSTLHTVSSAGLVRRNAPARELALLGVDTNQRLLALEETGDLFRWTDPSDDPSRFCRIVHPGQPISLAANGSKVFVLASQLETTWIASGTPKENA